MIEILLFLLLVIFFLQCYLLYLGIKTQGEIALVREYLAMMQADLVPDRKVPTMDTPERVQEDVEVHVFKAGETQPPSGELISSLKGYGNE